MKRALRFLTPAAAAGAALLALGTSAFAGTVSPGGPFSAKAAPFAFADGVTGATVTCASLTLGGALLSNPGPQIGTFGTGTAATCQTVLPLTVTLGGLPWAVNELAYNASSGVATGTITGVRAQLAGSGCTATLAGAGGATSTGTLNWTHSNAAPHLLTVSAASLKFWNAGCLGLLGNGDPAALTVQFVLSPPQTIS